MEAASSPLSYSNKAMPRNSPCKSHRPNDLLVNPNSLQCSERAKSTATLNDPHQPSLPQPTQELIRCMPWKTPPTNTAMSLQSEDILTLVEILDWVSGSNRMCAPFDPPHRLLRPQTWRLTSEERVFASSRDYVAHRPSYHVLPCSWITYQKRATSHSLPEGSWMFGRVATTRNVCALQCSTPTLPKICPKSGWYASDHLTCNARL
jgi:hypothetical protein